MFGWHNEFPMEFGGGPTLAERHYNALVSAPGTGGVATDTEDSIDAIWRQIKATAMANLDAFAEHAALQVFPKYAEELLYYYEDVLALTPDADASLAERQAAAQAEWNRLARADGPALEAALQRIDSRMVIQDQDHDYTTATHDGRMLAGYEGPPFGLRPGTDVPNYSDDFTVYVLFDLGNVPPTADEFRKIERAKRMLHLALSSWCDFEVLAATGFTLDESQLDLTTFV